METRIDRIGLDLGTAAQAESLAAAAAALGPDMVRVRFGLAGNVEPDAAYLEDVGRTVDALRAQGLRILAVVDSDLTVAPEGMGAFLDRPPGPLARAWTDEITTNVRRLATAIGDRVAAWEILPGANVGSPARIAPGRWASLMTTIAEALRSAAPGAVVVAGGLISGDSDDGMEYLRAAWRSALGTGLWKDGRPPFDSLGIRLQLMQDGKASEEALSAALRERTKRVSEALSELLGDAPGDGPTLMVTGLSWDVDQVGEDVQARNTWTALNALTAAPAVDMVIWTGLTDGNPHVAGATGLFRGSLPEPGAERYAWRAFRDFATYARQISPSPLAEAMRDAAQEQAAEARVEPPLASEPKDADADVAPPELVDAVPVETDLEESDESPTGEAVEHAVEPASADADADADAEVDVDADAAAAASELEPAEPEDAGDAAHEGEATEAEAPVEPGAGDLQPDEAALVPDEETETIEFRIPNAEEVLRGQGYAGAELETLLAAVQRRYGGHEWLPPGDYAVVVPRLAETVTAPDVEAEPSEAPGPTPDVLDRAGQAIPAIPPEPIDEPDDLTPASPELTNQQVISALYRAGGGTWAIFERSGLSLRELAAARTQAYAGPALPSLDGLSDAERDALRHEIERLA